MLPVTNIRTNDSLAQAIARKTDKEIVSGKTLSELIKRTAAVRNSPDELNAARREISNIRSQKAQRQMLRVMDYVIQHPETMDAGHQNVVNSLISVTMSMAKGKSVSGRDIRNLDLRNFNFQEADLRGLDLSNLDMQRADFSYANLNGVDASKSYMQRAKMIGVNAKGANLKEAKMFAVDARKGNFDSANMTDASLISADFCDANLNDVDASKADMTGTKLIHAKTSRMNTEGAKTDETVFSLRDLRPKRIIY